jgi:hypothetical protein
MRKAKVNPPEKKINEKISFFKEMHTLSDELEDLSGSLEVLLVRSKMKHSTF